MTKEQIFKIIDEELEKRKNDTFLLWDFPNDIKKRVEEQEKDLEVLEQIDNAKPSEALNSLEYICKILNEKRIDVKWLFKNDYNTIKQALLKAQEKDKILEILKNKLIIHCEDNVLTITTGLKNQTIEKLVDDNKEKSIKEWLDGKD